MASTNAKTRSDGAELESMANTIRAARAHVGWELALIHLPPHEDLGGVCGNVGVVEPRARSSHCEVARYMDYRTPKRGTR